MDYDYNAALVLDCGSYFCKIGLSSDAYPSSIFPTLVGQNRYRGIMVGMNLKEWYVGNEAKCKRAILTLKYPIQCGSITNWDCMERIWHNAIYNELHVNPEEHPVLLTDDPLNSKVNREKMTEIMFENFSTPAMYISSQAVLSLYASGRTTGLVLDSGHNITRTVPIFDGYAIRSKILSVDIGGSDVTDYLIKLLSERGYSLTCGAIEIVRDIKEKLCYTAMDNAALQTEYSCYTIRKNYELPDGQIITIDNERFLATEPLYKPTYIGKECPSVQQLINNSINSCDIDIRKDLYAKIVLSGNTTLFPGFSDRVQQEVSKYAPSNVQTSVHADPNRNYSSWIGGSILASTPFFKHICFNKNEYDECGPTIVYRKYF